MMLAEEHPEQLLQAVILGIFLRGNKIPLGIHAVGNFNARPTRILMACALKLSLQPTAHGEFAKNPMSKFWTAEQPLGTL